jgi:hypothetical protein
VIMDIAGRVGARMLRRYSRIQLEAKRAAIQALSNHPQTVPSAGLSKVADVTIHVTKLGEAGEAEAAAHRKSSKALLGAWGLGPQTSAARSSALIAVDFTSASAPARPKFRLGVELSASSQSGGAFRLLSKRVLRVAHVRDGWDKMSSPWPRGYSLCVAQEGRASR